MYTYEEGFQAGKLQGMQIVINQMKGYHADTVYKLLVERIDIQLSTEEYAMDQALRFSNFIQELEQTYLNYEEEEI